MADDLTTAYLLGVEHMRSKLHKHADEIERLRDENEKLRLEMDMQQATILVPSQKDDQRRIERLDAAIKEALDEAAALRAENETLRRDVKTAVMGDSAELQDVKRENEKLREALKPFADFEKAVLGSYHYDKMPDDKIMITTGAGETHIWICRKHLRAAAAALKETDND